MKTENNKQNVKLGQDIKKFKKGRKIERAVERDRKALGGRESDTERGRERKKDRERERERGGGGRRCLFKHDISCVDMVELDIYRRVSKESIIDQYIN